MTSRLSPIQHVIVLLGTIGIAIIALIFSMINHRSIGALERGDHQPAAVAEPSATAVKPAVKLSAPAPAQTFAERMKLANVERGGSFIRSVGRQLKADPVTWGFKGDPADAHAVKKWADREATLIAIRDEKFSPEYGAEIRVKTPDRTAYLLEKGSDGQTTVAVFSRGRGESYGTSPTKVEQLASSSTRVPDWLNTHQPVPPNEYLYNG